MDKYSRHCTCVQISHQDYTWLAREIALSTLLRLSDLRKKEPSFVRGWYARRTYHCINSLNAVQRPPIKTASNDALWKKGLNFNKSLRLFLLDTKVWEPASSSQQKLIEEYIKKPTFSLLDHSTCCQGLFVLNSFPFLSPFCAFGHNLMIRQTNSRLLWDQHKNLRSNNLTYGEMPTTSKNTALNKTLFSPRREKLETALLQQFNFTYASSNKSVMICG